MLTQPVTPGEASVVVVPYYSCIQNRECISTSACWVDRLQIRIRSHLPGLRSFADGQLNGEHDGEHDGESARFRDIFTLNVNFHGGLSDIELPQCKSGYYYQ